MKRQHWCGFQAGNALTTPPMLEFLIRMPRLAAAC
jgi:hypothetical protein